MALFCGSEAPAVKPGWDDLKRSFEYPLDWPNYPLE
jgi:hypothetical protein